MEDLMRAKDILDAIKRNKERLAPAEAKGAMFYGYRRASDHISELIARTIPTVDAVEVVRCRDCKKYREKFFPSGESYGWFCSETHYGRKPDDFCSYAERKDNGNA